MSVVNHGCNIEMLQRVFEKDYVLNFHKGFVLTDHQYQEVKAYLDAHDFNAVEKFLEKNFSSDVSIVRGMLENQKRLKKEGYYDRKSGK